MPRATAWHHRRELLQMRGEITTGHAVRCVKSEEAVRHYMLKLTYANAFKWTLGSIAFALGVIGVKILILHAQPGDTMAARELGQPDFSHNTANIPGPGVL